MHPLRLSPAALLAITLSLLVTCTVVVMSPPPSRAAEPGGATVTPVGRPPPMTFRVPGSTRKVCQLIGEVDHQRREATAARTQTQFGLFGTDLGAAVQHGRRTYFFFGDTHPSRAPTASRPAGGDSIGYTEATTAGCTDLQMVTAPELSRPAADRGDAQRPLLLAGAGHPGAGRGRGVAGRAQ